MNSPQPFWMTSVERVVGFILFVSILPTLLLIGLFIGVTAGSPIVLTDAVEGDVGAVNHSLRFRTTGEGTAAFRFVARFMRRWAIDELPALWSVARSDIRLSDVCRYFTQRMRDRQPNNN